MAEIADLGAAWRYCYTCRDYLTERREALVPAIARAAIVVEMTEAFMHGAHRRHTEDGEPLRPGGPTRVTDPDLGKIMATWAMLGRMVP